MVPQSAWTAPVSLARATCAQGCGSRKSFGPHQGGKLVGMTRHIRRQVGARPRNCARRLLRHKALCPHDPRALLPFGARSV